MLLILLLLNINPYDFAVVVKDPLKDIDPKHLHTLENSTRDGGRFKSPGNSHGYLAGVAYGWLIKTPVTADITVFFHDFDLEESLRCFQADYVVIYEGKVEEDQSLTWTQIGLQSGYCGNLDSFGLTTSASHLLVKFASDLSKQAKGFNASFVARLHLPPNITYIGDMMRTMGDQPQTTIHSITVEEESEIQLQCDAQSSIPKPSYKWEKFNTATSLYQPLKNSLIRFERTNGSISLHNFAINDSGVYKCTASSSYGIDQDVMHINVTERCPCPRIIRASWVEYPPYTQSLNAVDDGGKIVEKHDGLLDMFLEKMVKDVCGECSKVVYSKGISNFKSLDDEILKDDQSVDIFFPVQSGDLADRYKLKYYFLPMIKAPSIAHYTPKAAVRSDVLWTSLSAGWAIFIMCVILSIFAGMVIWLLDTYWNEEQFPRSFTKGVVEGFWWAIISMTTVGYGDKAPVSIPARLFAIAWILAGLCMVAIFTSVLSTSLTVSVLTNEAKLYGSNIGAIHHTYESRIGFLKQAKMKGYSSVSDMEAAMNSMEIQGILLDSYVAGHSHGTFDKYRVSRVFQTRKNYGFALGRRLSTSSMYKLLKEFGEKNEDYVAALVESKTSSPHSTLSSNAIENTEQLISNENHIFQEAVKYISITLGALIVCGLLFEYCFLRPRHRMIESAKRTELCQSKAVKEMIFRSNLLKSVLLREVKQFKGRWKDRMQYAKDRNQVELKKMKIKLKKPCIQELVDAVVIVPIQQQSNRSRFEETQH